MQQWYVSAKKADFKGIGERFGIDQVVARLIRNRGIVGNENIREFLEGGLSDIPDVRQLKDIEKLVKILIKKIEEGAKIRIIGDYDADGVMSSHILSTALKRVGANADVVIPHRIHDGYGLNRQLVENADADGVEVILTCDNGIAAIDEIAYAKELGMTVLVTDHHAIPFTEENGVQTEKESAADAVVNPHQKACEYPYKELCGAGVAWCVVCVLYEELGIDKAEAEELLEFAAVATVCDVMSLTGVNRILVKEGIRRIHNTKNIGMKALIDACGITPEQIEAFHFGFVIGPCVNATGRLDTAKRALELFSTEDPSLAREIAEELVELNVQRKELTLSGVEKARRIVAEGGYEKDPILVIYMPEVHESIAGLIAGRIREAYSRPTYVLTRAEEGAKGSGRSTEEYSMYEEMCKCSDLFTRFGGHPMAAGLSLPEENIPVFRKRINELCPCSLEELEPKVHIDMQMPVEYVTPDLIRQFSVLEPCGKDNPRPLFAEKNLSVTRLWVVGKKQNVLRLNLRTPKGRTVSAIYFGDVGKFQQYIAEKFGRGALTYEMEGRPNSVRISIVYVPKIDTYRDRENLQFEIKYYR
jgi:single-stranded-DNA-specific exonuclease